MPEEKDYDSMTIEELEQESAKNPVEKEVPVPEAEAEVQTQEPREKQQSQTVPYDRFDEVNKARKQAEDLLARYQLDAIQRAQQSRPQAPPPTPAELAEYNGNQALLEPYLRPLHQQIQTLNAEINETRIEKRVNEAEQYLRRSIPDYDHIAPELFLEIQKRSPVVQEKIYADPDWLIELANTVKMKKSEGTFNAEAAAKQDLKKRAVSESRGSSGPPIKTTSRIDPEYERIINHGSIAELTTYEMKHGIK